MVNPTIERDPIVLSRHLKYLSKAVKPRASWVENLDTVEEQKLGMLDLHPQVWAAMPRTDIISNNIHWQRLYKYVVRLILELKGYDSSNPV